jgi:hypothetical protein
MMPANAHDGEEPGAKGRKRISKASKLWEVDCVLAFE